MKRIITLALALTMLLVATLSFTACGQTDDWKTVEDRGYFYCGITVYAPMNYYDDDGNLIKTDIGALLPFAWRPVAVEEESEEA